MPVTTNIEDLRVLAQRRVPRMFYDYADSGSWTESTYRANETDFARIKLRQRVAVNMENRSLATTMAGVPVSMPVALAPTGLTGMQHADGEILAARAAEKFGVPFTLSTMSICSIEDIAANTQAPFWFQLYMMRDRGFIERLIERARAAKCGALVLTLDLQILGQRHKDIRNGLSTPPRMTLPNILDIARRPRWWLGMLGTKRRQFGNIVGHVTGVADMSSLSEWTATQFDPALSWADIEWVKRRWNGKLVLKGVLDVEDARRAADSGADALVVSNHGGRQLDGAPSSISALPAIAEAVGDRSVAAPEGLPSDWLAGISAVPDPAPEPQLLDRLGGVLTTCAAAIAETGTIVLDHGPGQGVRALTLVPDYHLVVVFADQIAADVPEALERIDSRRPLTFVSGPSATSDIELSRVEGVHGPRTLEVLLVP